MDDFDEFDIHEEEPPSKLKKAIIVIIAIFLVFLMVTYIFVTSGAVHGFLTSKKISNFQIKTNDLTIIFQDNTLEQLQEHYIKNNHREIKACLQGTKQNNIYTINKITFPDVSSASVVHIQAKYCPENTLIDLHSHPINRCLASEQDLRYFSEIKILNQNLVMLVMCSKSRFSVVV